MPFPSAYIDTIKVSKHWYPGFQNHRLNDLKLRDMIPEREEYPAILDAMDAHLCYQCMIEDMKKRRPQK